MNDEHLMQILQLGKDEKEELLNILLHDLGIKGEGMHFQPTGTLSDKSKIELIRRQQDILEEKECLIHFDDHILYFQKLRNA
jgi:hypothetical protein